MGANSTPTLSIENLESRLNLSTLTTILAQAPASSTGSTVQDVATSTSVRYRLDSFTNAAGATQGATYTNTTYSAAQQFFNRFKNTYTAYTGPAPTNTDPTTTDPGTTTNPPTTTPPATSDPSTTPVTITQQSEGNITRLTITGTTGNDSILVSQSGNTLTIKANGQTSTVSGTFGELAIYGISGNDAITVQSSVNIASLIYSGTGNDTIIAQSSAQSYVVTIGGGTDTLTGNGVNTSFWANPNDVINATPTETTNGDIHRVSSFYQPFTTNVASSQYIPLSLNGQNLPDPTDSGTEINLSNNSLWGTGPSMTDVNQGEIGDCYFLASIQSFAVATPAKLQEMAVDLGDGTYAVEFQRNGVNSYVRVDADFPTGPFNGLANDSPSPGGPIWSVVMEKAYAFYRTGQNTYASLNYGWTGSAYSDLGVASNEFYTNSSNIYSQLQTAIAGNKAVAVITNSTIASSIPIIGSHAYSILAVSTDGSGTQWVTLRNPWGVDGAGDDSNPYDGIVKVTLAQFQASTSAGSISV